MRDFGFFGYNTPESVHYDNGDGSFSEAHPPNPPHAQSPFGFIDQLPDTLLGTAFSPKAFFQKLPKEISKVGFTIDLYSPDAASHLEYAIQTSHRLRDELISKLPDTPVISTIDFSYYTALTALKALEAKQDSGLISTVAYKIFNKAFLSNLIDAGIFEIMFVSEEKFTRETSAMLSSLPQSIDETKLSTFFEKFKSLSADNHDENQDAPEHDPATVNSLRELVQDAREMVTSATIDHDYQNKYPRISKCLYDVFALLYSLLDSFDESLLNDEGLKESNWDTDLVLESIIQGLVSLKESSFDELFNDPQCAALLLKTLNNHLELGQLLLNNVKKRHNQPEPSPGGIDSEIESEIDKIEPAKSFIANILFNYFNNDVMAHIAKRMPEYLEIDQSNSSNGLSMT
ncbi:MAG: hypothetical protein VX112_01975 [Pseudomonadota bacterium]|nr:hypothetical protein [Pseudomonadota bacterium]